MISTRNRPSKPLTGRVALAAGATRGAGWCETFDGDGSRSLPARRGVRSSPGVAAFDAELGQLPSKSFDGVERVTVGPIPPSIGNQSAVLQSRDHDRIASRVNPILDTLNVWSHEVDRRVLRVSLL